MMISGGSFPPRLTRIDDLTRPDHSYLGPEDTCYFIGEYTARRGYTFSETNDIIINFKKSVDRKGKLEWRFKEWALQKAASAFRAALHPKSLTATLVPVPPSKARDHPLYDDRMVRMLQAIRPNPPLDIRELVVQRFSTEAVHDLPIRPRPEDLEALYDVDKALLTPPPRVLVIVDDVLTTGAHYRAMAVVLGRTFPGVRTIGLFMARRAPDTSDIEDFL